MYIYMYKCFLCNVKSIFLSKKMKKKKKKKK